MYFSIKCSISALREFNQLLDYRQHCAKRNAPVFHLLRGRFWGFSPRKLLPLLRLIPPMEQFPTSYHRKWYIAKN